MSLFLNFITAMRQIMIKDQDEISNFFFHIDWQHADVFTLGTSEQTKRIRIEKQNGFVCCVNNACASLLTR